MNYVSLIGWVGKDPEIRTAGDRQVANFTLATSETYKDKNGEKKTQTQWHTIVVWGKQAAFVEGYIKKGNPIRVEGKITYRKWDSDEGTKWFTEIVASQVAFLPSKTNGTSEGPKEEKPKDAAWTEPDGDDDLPF